MGKNGRIRFWKLAQSTATNCGRRSRLQNNANKLSHKKNKMQIKKIKKQIKNQKINKNQKIKKKKTSSKVIGITAASLTSALNCFPNFIGCIPEDKLNDLVLRSLPCFIIVNIDSGNLPGSHWITLGIFPNSIEIFDSLGFDLFNWTRVPCTLLNFVHRLSVTRKVIVSHRIQSDYSTLCGFYCLFYMFMRYHTCMKTVLSYFGPKLACNDSILTKFFS